MGFNSPKVALVYDWVTTQYGGAEQILTALHGLYPQAPLFTSIADSKNVQWNKEWETNTSFLQKIPFASRFYRFLAPLMPVAFEQFDLSNFDIIISVSSGFAKGVITQPHQLHVNYLLTPPRFLYSHQDKYLSESTVFNPLTHYLREWDKVASRRADKIIPISNLIYKRVEKYYALKPLKPVYPPVPKLTQKTPHTDSIAKPYYLMVSRLVSYKNVDSVIKACQKLKRNLIIVGCGPDQKYIEDCIAQTPAPISITLKPCVSEAELAELYANATAVIQPNIEDFGIAVLEGQHLGTPSILHQESGAAELLSEKQCVFISDIHVKSIVAAMKVVESKTFSSQQLINNMKKYDTNNFIRVFAHTIDQLWEEHQNSK